MQDPASEGVAPVSGDSVEAEYQTLLAQRESTFSLSFCCFLSTPHPDPQFSMQKLLTAENLENTKKGKNGKQNIALAITKHATRASPPTIRLAGPKVSPWKQLLLPAL